MDSDVVIVASYRAWHFDLVGAIDSAEGREKQRLVFRVPEERNGTWRE